MDLITMDWLFIISLILVLLYININVLIHMGLNKSLPTNKNKPTVSILIAARNEEINILDCLTSIEKLDYPKPKLEVLIINDQSEDKTEKITKSFCDRLNHFTLLKIIDSKFGLYGKMNALAQGIDKTSGEIILITDADCEVPINWVSEFVKYFEKDVGMCGALTVLSKNENKENFFTRLQTLDWIYLQAIASGSCQLGSPISILGNNFAFRRKAYTDIGGFEKLGFSLTEDMALLQAIHNFKKWKIVYPLNNKTKIYSKPANTITEFYHQRKRWVLGGRSTHPWGYFIALISLITHVFLFWIMLTVLWEAGILFALVTAIADVSIFARILNRIKRNDLYSILVVFKLYYSIYMTVFSLVLLTGKKVKWKQINHKV